MKLKLICQTCGNEFNWNQTSTIKPKDCLICTNKKLLNKSTISPKKKKPKKPSKSVAMKTADKWFSIYIRLFHSIEASGIRVGKCYTCGAVHSLKSCHCGHFQRRGYKATRYHESNCRIQCVRCNHFRSGEPEKFRLNLIKEIGLADVEALEVLAQSDFRDSTEYYRETAEHYRKKVNELVKEHNVEKWW